MDRVSDHEAITPLIVSSPVGRSGTTLVQRLLCSSQNGICYGENTFEEVSQLAGFLCQRIRFHLSNRDSELQGLKEVLEKKTDRWMPDLAPEYDGYQSALLSTFYTLPLFLQDYSRNIGRSLWGMKKPGLEPETIQDIFLLLPRARMIYIYRDIFDCIRSAKARKFTPTLDSVRLLCRRWQRNLTSITDVIDEENCFILQYEHLSQEPEQYIQALEQWSGVKGINLDVMKVKVNTWVGEEKNGHSAVQYIPPAELTAEEIAVITETTEETYRVFYPDSDCR